MTTVSETAHYPVVILGGGLGGLTAAWRCQENGLDSLVLEASNRVGGLVQTDDWQGCRLEQGPDGFVARKPAFRLLAQELGLAIQELLPTRNRIYLASARGNWPLPAGQGLLVPTKLWPFLRSPILSRRGRLRLLLERFVARGPTAADESLANFVRRRFGAEALSQLAEPLLGGVYNTDPEILSLAAAFPQYLVMEQQFGSVIKGMATAKQPSSLAEGGRVQSLSGGMSSIVQALQTRLAGQIKTNAPAMAIDQHRQGYIVHCQDGTAVTAKAVILALPASSASRLLRHLSPEAARLLSPATSAGIGTISLIYETKALAQTPDAWGVLYARDSGSPIDGWQWTTAKWADRAPLGTTIIRGFFGGFRHRELLAANDEAVLALAAQVLEPFLVPGSIPLYSTIKRWENAFPQYAVGYREIIAKVESLLPQRISLVGQAFHGVGLPAVVASANRAAQAISS